MGLGRAVKICKLFCLLLNKTSCALVHPLTYKEKEKWERNGFSCCHQAKNLMNSTQNSTPTAGFFEREQSVLLEGI